MDFGHLLSRASPFPLPQKLTVLQSVWSTNCVIDGATSGLDTEALEHLAILHGKMISSRDLGICSKENTFFIIGILTLG
jgi:hypothetical protein